MRMGADMKVEGNSVFIKGVDKLMGATVSALDLRAGAAMVIAALMAEGQSVIEQVEYVERGYENFEVKLRGLGANIIRVDDDAPTGVKKNTVKIG